jgi:hypothetical protein
MYVKFTGKPLKLRASAFFGDLQFVNGLKLLTCVASSAPPPLLPIYSYLRRLDLFSLSLYILESVNKTTLMLLIAQGREQVSKS